MRIARLNFSFVVLAMLAACGGSPDDSNLIATVPLALTADDPTTNLTTDPAESASAVEFRMAAMTTGPALQQTARGLAFSTQGNFGKANVACSGAANATAVVKRARLAQTHLMLPGHPFFQLSAKRAVQLRVNLTGEGASPQVLVAAWANGVRLGKFCMTGPTQLPATTSIGPAPDDSKEFVGYVPATWVVPGLSLRIAPKGGKPRLLGAALLKVGEEPELNLVTMNWMLFGDTEITPWPAGGKRELAARLPLSRVRYASFPLWVKTPELPIAVRSDGYRPDGTVTTQPAMVTTAMPHCSGADKIAGTCTPHSGYAVISAVRNLTGELQSANGLNRLAHWYGALSKNRHAGGGLGGGVVSAGDDYDLTFNHELGHTFNMPHWGDALYIRAATTATSIHPYTGSLQANGAPKGGGFGNTWAFDPITGTYMDPICASNGLERQEPMQRGNTCLPAGMTYDHFSDYSAQFIHRYFTGATSEHRGTVASARDQLGNTHAAPFAMPVASGRPNLDLSDPAHPRIMQWNPATATYSELTAASLSDPRTFGEKYPLQWNVPVMTLWGSFSLATPEANLILPPIQYKGNLQRIWDPTDATDLAEIKGFISGDSFWWGADLVVKAEFSDGTARHALVKKNVRSTDPLSTGSQAYWAINLPQPATGVKLTQVSVFHRPMDVRYSDNGNIASSYYSATNLNSSLNSGLTAAQYLSTAQLVSTRQF